MSSRFPSLEADDIIQETFAAIASALPRYKYAPDSKGRFKNYITGILRNKALNAIRKAQRLDRIAKEYSLGLSIAENTGILSGEHLKETIYAIALDQLMADTSISERSKRIFARIAINGEKPDAVAESLGVSRNAADQTKRRMTARLRAIADALKEAYGQEP